ncbi:MAG: hypothetical protein IPK76_09545 [Lewinellaceae bacterium]|nr:hypothetical protein [Lewinellaceae bacterium]
MENIINIITVRAWQYEHSLQTAGVKIRTIGVVGGSRIQVISVFHHFIIIIGNRASVAVKLQFAVGIADAGAELKKSMARGFCDGWEAFD